jgi:hypothetical protein
MGRGLGGVDVALIYAWRGTPCGTFIPDLEPSKLFYRQAVNIGTPASAAPSLGRTGGGRSNRRSNRRSKMRADIPKSWRDASPTLGLAALLLGAFVVLAQPSGGQVRASTLKSPAARNQQQGTPTITPTCQPAWSLVPSPNPGLDFDRLNGVAAVSDNDVWAVGSYADKINNAVETLVERWDGSSWSVVPSPNPGAFNTLGGVAVVSANDVWAVGTYADCISCPPQTLVEHWNGSAWSVVPSPNRNTSENYLSGVAAVSANDVWAVGSSGSDPNYQTLVEHWDGSNWSVVPSPNPVTGDNYLAGVAAASANNVWAVGSYANKIGNAVETLVEHWDGSSWSVVLSPNPGLDFNTLGGVAAVSDNDVWAVGTYAGCPLCPLQTLVEHWGGSSWSVVPSPSLGIYDNELYGVAAVSANDVWAVGRYFNRRSNAWHSLVEHWDGSSWSVVPSPNPDGSDSELRGVAAVSANDVWAVGDFANTTGPLAQTLVERYSELPFTDVHTSDYFYQAVRYLYCHGVISGYADSTFRPYNLTTRGQFCKIAVLAEGWTIYTPPSPTFRDVPVTNPFYTFIETAYNHGIISGYSCGPGCLEFRPGNNVIRGQVCKIVVLAEGWPVYTPPTPTFRDVPTAHTFYSFIETAYNHDIISGYNCGPGCLEFRPGNNATRGQLCKIVYQAVTQP